MNLWNGLGPPEASTGVLLQGHARATVRTGTLTITTSAATTVSDDVSLTISFSPSVEVT